MADDLEQELMDAADKVAPSQDKLDTIRAACKRARELILLIAELEENRKAASKELLTLRYENLPDLFAQCGVDRVDLAAEGNLPAYSVKMEDQFYAKIAADWPQEQKDAAYDWLEEKGCGDLIKRVIEIRVGLREEKFYNAVMTALLKVPKIQQHLHESRSVPWNTLSAWLKEQCEEGVEFGDIDLQRIGGKLGKVVNLKQVKEKSNG